jgi:hypothetical protein
VAAHRHTVATLIECDRACGSMTVKIGESETSIERQAREGQVCGMLGSIYLRWTHGVRVGWSATLG